jgi:hypothetical protein
VSSYFAAQVGDMKIRRGRTSIRHGRIMIRFTFFMKFLLMKGDKRGNEKTIIVRKILLAIHV